MKFLCEFTLPSIFRCGPVRFYPGVNEVQSEQWDKIKDSQLLAKRFELGHLKWVEGKGPDNIKPEAKSLVADGVVSNAVDTKPDYPLADLNSKDSQALIAKTYSLDLLDAWLEIEERVGVRRAIEAQRELLLVKKEDVEEKEKSE